MITYETLRNIEHEEKNSVKLSKLPQDFLQEAMQYLQNKEAIANEKEDELELETARHRVESIMQIRERKILSFTLSFVRSGAIPENLMLEERELFNNIVKNLQDYQKKRSVVMSGEKVRLRAVAFIQEIPRFVGIDMGQYGPYKPGDIATIPEDNAKVLVDRGACEFVESGL